MSKLMVFAAAGGLCAIMGIVKLFQIKVSNVCQKDPNFEKAIDILRNHKGTLKYIGEPVEILNTKFGYGGIRDRNIYETVTKIKGPISDGLVFITTIRNGDQICLDSVQLQIGKDNNRRLLIKESTLQKNLLDNKSS